MDTDLGELVHDVVTDDPSVYLRPPVSPEEHLLAEQTSKSDGDAVPFWMFAKLAIRHRRHGRWISRVDGLFRAARRYSRTALATLAANLFLIVGFVLHRATLEGASTEHEAAAERAEIEYRRVQDQRVEGLEKQIIELRAVLLRLGVVVPSPSTDGLDYPESGERFSDLGTDPQILASAASSQPPKYVPLPRPGPDTSCGNICSTNTECNMGLIPTCKFCNFGTCSSHRPESPIMDAGVPDVLVHVPDAPSEK